uniref:3',5'-cyclic-nucleotide phosphodiesterase n=1 Tax=Chromera velia CCMP2878 TaxID=1169474 RepID=A0A0G4GT12_9ALVE|eukprot:Cvel_5173.t1-p1 / transcript=Cvel_5173.t1 / gene=Cvel_5173 / organism=Chromera_velia_CCMP2878 / gene_product=3',5'-cyclic-nucleotide phosphodiesterase, putative / transcript_product=3',5'-cyclic-nucleotide phosphodiesterase, putative / location=Cvel_scaffold237:65954-68014(+) / protein_length=482 / sequence_SO=supercontig / SO=protein_coding / is_pseudo=false
MVVGRWTLAGFLALLQFNCVASKFLVVVGGEYGGIVTGRTSGYLATHVPEGESLSPNFKFLALDAGELLNGLHACMTAQGDAKEPCKTINDMKSSDTATPNYLEAAYTAFKEKLAGVFISHAHLDHVAGLAMTCPNLAENNMPVFGREVVIDHMKSSVFNNVIFPDLTYGGAIWKITAGFSKSQKPEETVKSRMKYYELSDRTLPSSDKRLSPNALDFLMPSETANVHAHKAGPVLEDIPGTGLEILASYPLEHLVGGVSLGSSAILVGSVPQKTKGKVPEELLYFGDHGPKNTGSDAVAVWLQATSAIFSDLCLNHMASGRLKGVFTEVSYDNSVTMLFNHVIPDLLRLFLSAIAKACPDWAGKVSKGKLPKLDVVIGHRKPISGTASSVEEAFGMPDTDELIQSQIIADAFSSSKDSQIQNFMRKSLFNIVFAKQGDVITIPKPEGPKQEDNQSPTNDDSRTHEASELVEIHLRGSTKKA